MPQFAANLSMMYTEHPFLDRFEAAAKDGFTAVEFLFPYAHAAAGLAARLQANGLRQVLFNAPPGGTSAESVAAALSDTRQRGTACLPGRENEFQSGVLMALEYAEALDCPRIHLMAGLMPEGAGREELREVYLTNLRWAARQAAQAGRGELLTVELPVAAIAGAWDLPLSAVAHDGDQAYVFAPNPTSHLSFAARLATSRGTRFPKAGYLLSK